MEVSVLDAQALQEALTRLITNHEDIYRAVAWAHAGPVAEKLIKNKHKFRSVTVGLDFCATDTDFVDSLCDVPNAFVFKKSGACFHPKIYLFVSGHHVEAIVGSANFTAGGLSTNVEACLHLSCHVGEEIFSKLLKTLQSYERHRQIVTKQLADAYRRQTEIAASRPRPRSPVLPSDKAEFQRIDSDFLKMGWAVFIDELRTDPDHHFEKRMNFLRYIQTLFARVQLFDDLTVSEWKAVAGIMHPDAGADSGLKKYQIGWFGSMQGSGSFTNLIANKDQRIAKAIDCIPRRGAVAEGDFKCFCTLFESAFADSVRTGRTATATRLLAMKRPDMFVCVNNRNKASLAKALHFAPSTLSLRNYWERVIEPIRLANWYNAPRPEGPDAEAWDCRAALVDAIHCEAFN